MALSPTLAGFAGQQSGNMASDELRRFLLQFFEDRPSQQPLLTGFFALRRVQLVWLMEKFGVDAADTTAADDLVRICEVAWMQGKFPKPPAPEDLPTEVRRLREMVEKLSADRATDPNVVQVAAPVPAPVPAISEPEPDARVTAYSGLKWDRLRALAKKNLPSTFKLHGRKRWEIEDALEIENVEIPAEWLDEPFMPDTAG